MALAGASCLCCTPLCSRPAGASNLPSTGRQNQCCRLPEHRCAVLLIAAMEALPGNTPSAAPPHAAGQGRSSCSCSGTCHQPSMQTCLAPRMAANRPPACRGPTRQSQPRPKHLQAMRAGPAHAVPVASPIAQSARSADLALMQLPVVPGSAARSLPDRSSSATSWAPVSCCLLPQ